MTRKGFITRYTVDIVSKRYMSVILFVFLKDAGETVPVELSGSVADVCGKLNTIPIAGTLTGRHLKDATCTVFKEGEHFRFIALDDHDHRKQAG